VGDFITVGSEEGTVAHFGALKLVLASPLTQTRPAGTVVGVKGVGGTGSTLAREAKQGEFKVEVESTSGFAEGDVLSIGTETNSLRGISLTVILSNCLKFDHPPGTIVLRSKAETPAPTPSSDLPVCQGQCWQARKSAYPNCVGYETSGYKCVGDYCAACDPIGRPENCAEKQPAGTSPDFVSGLCKPNQAPAGATNTKLTREANAGDTKIDVLSTAGSVVGDPIALGGEEAEISGFGEKSIVLTGPLYEHHPNSAIVRSQAMTAVPTPAPTLPFASCPKKADEEPALPVVGHHHHRMPRVIRRLGELHQAHHELPHKPP